MMTKFFGIERQFIRMTFSWQCRRRFSGKWYDHVKMSTFLILRSWQVYHYEKWCPKSELKFGVEISHLCPRSWTSQYQSFLDFRNEFSGSMTASGGKGQLSCSRSKQHCTLNFQFSTFEGQCSRWGEQCQFFIRVSWLGRGTGGEDWALFEVAYSNARGGDSRCLGS